MDIAPSIVMPLLLLLISSAAASPSAASPAVAPAAGEHTSGSDIYIVFVSRADYVDSLDYDVRLLASVVGSTEEAKRAILHHYSGLGFAARLTGNQADKLSKKDGVATFKDKTYHVQNDGRLPRFYEENI